MTFAPNSHPSQKVSWTHLVCGTFVVLWLSVGVATSISTSVPSAVKIVILGTWFLLASVRSMSFLGTMTINAWPLVVMLLISVLYTSEVQLSNQYTQGLAYLLIAFSFLCFYSTPQFRREGYILMGVMAADLAITGVRSFVALQADPLLSRYLATTEENRVAVYGNQSFAGIGGYGYAYSLAAVLLILLYFLVWSKGARIALAVSLTAGLVVLFALAFTTAIVLVLVLGTGFLLRDLVRRRELQVLILAGLFLGWITGLYPAILRALAGWSWVTSEVSERLSELADFLSGGVATGSDLGTRLAQWRQSLDTFLRSGPFGLAEGADSSLNHGGHSQWLDLLASYGIYVLLLGLFLLFAWRAGSGRAIKTEVEPLKRAWIYFLLLGLVNPLLLSTIVLTWMFFLPFLVSWLGETSARRNIGVNERATA